MNDAIFRPQVLPRDLTDALVALVVGIFQTLVLFVLPGAIGFWLSDSMVLAVFASMLAYLIYACFLVSHLELSPRGIEFSRLLGTPKFLPWSSITAVEEVSRSEVVRRGWLWPLFPAREMTPSLSSLGHYAIRFGKDCVYFPPRDPVAFMEAVRSLRGEQG